MSQEFSDEELSRYRELARSARQEAHRLCGQTEGWSTAAREEGGDTVLEWREPEPGLTRADGEAGGQAGWKCWRLTCVLEADMEDVISVLMDYDKAVSWNPALAHTEILARPDEELMLTYQVTAGQRPFVTQRDFTFLVSSVMEAGVWIAGGTSLPLASHPASGRYVRAWQHPTCMELRPVEGGRGQTRFTWLLQCDFGGLLPVSLLNMVMPYCIKLFTNSLKKHLKKMGK